MAKNCGVCAHWTKMEDGPRPRGDCHRYPPTPVVVLTKMDAQTGILSTTSVQCMYASTFAEWGCGEHRPKLEVVG